MLLEAEGLKSDISTEGSKTNEKQNWNSGNKNNR